MRNLWKKLLGLGVIGMGLGVSASAQAATGVGPYYAMPSWDQTLPASTRFIVLTNMNSKAVLDRETGLVWEQSPGTSTLSHESAQRHCNQKTVGSRKGWRLPTVQDLTSLTDPTVASPPDLMLPSGHPFSNVQSTAYWSATSVAVADAAADAWLVGFVGDFVGWGGKGNLAFVWCVRGGPGVDAQ